MKVKEALTLFLGEYDNPYTRRGFEQTLLKLADYVGGSRPITKVTSVEVLEFVHGLRESDLADATVAKHIKGLKRFFAWLEEAKFIEDNPAAIVRQKKLKRYIEKDKAMTDEELAAILDYTKYKPLHHAVILFLADTGCRAGGCAGLKLSTLHLDEGTAKVTEKGDKTREVWFGDQCAWSLRRWLIARPPQPHDFVFCHSGGPYNADTISQIVRRACLAMGLRSLGSHSLRHRKGHQMADEHIPVTVAATALGHSNPSTTMMHYYPGDTERAKKAIEELATTYQQEAPKIVPFKRKYK